MEYLLKASALIAIFYVCYILFLQRETFFDANRWFLAFGLVTAVLLPMMVIPIYVEMPATPSDGFSMMATTVQNSPEVSFDVTSLIMWIYAIGASFFLSRLLIQLFSLITLIKNKDKHKCDRYTYIKTSQNLTPFSFFRWIVYNPTQFNAEELELILQHEKIHASQLHSMDTVLMDLATALFWFNPFIWWYRKALKQNLEFIADHHTQKQSKSEERYQKLLLKTSLPEQHFIFINTFYNSTIKIRIVMLHKSKSNLMNTWKYTIIVPLMIIFAMTFNTETIAQTSIEASETATNDQQNILKFVVTKDTKDKQLEAIKDKLADKGATISFKNVKRNQKNEITAIKIKFEYKDNSGNNYINLSQPINPITISVNPSNHSINVGQQTSELSQTFEIKSDEDGQTILTESTTESKENSFRIVGNKINKDTTNKDTIFIENTTGKVGYTNTIDENNKVIFVKKTNNTTHVFDNDENSPLVFFDGKEIKNDEIKTIHPNSIKSIQVIKDEAATKKYGEKGENGVILITSKKNDFSTTDNGELIIITEDKNQKSSSTSNNGERPLYIINGKEITKKELEKMDPSTFGTIDILKDEQATKKYGEKGKNGVVLITTKKE